jgi:hypothetical protein
LDFGTGTMTCQNSCASTSAAAAANPADVNGCCRAADELPREIVGTWCVAIERMLPGKTYTYRRCKDSNWDIIVRWDGFDAQETSCELNTIKRQGAAWLASFGCSGAGLTWLEEDEIRVGKDCWTLEAKIKNVRRVGDLIRYCLGNKC